LRVLALMLGNAKTRPTHAGDVFKVWRTLIRSKGTASSQAGFLRRVNTALNLRKSRGALLGAEKRRNR
jgi:hypothetical protein